jgi:hypothetical protein
MHQMRISILSLFSGTQAEKEIVKTKTKKKTLYSSQNNPNTLP